MYRLVRPATLMLILAVLLTGCSFSLSKLLRSEPAEKETDDKEPAAQAEAPPPPVPAESLFPAEGWHVTFAVTDMGKEPVTVEEELIRDGSRIVATYNTFPYLNWMLDDDGVWRVDPRGGGALLRYLPASLVDGESWKQMSGDAEVWFQLRRSAGQCRGWFWTGQPDQCWELTVLNRGERTTFVLVSGIGPTYVNAENWTTPRESFEKKATAHRDGELTDERRASVLGQIQPPTAARAAVTPVTAAEFDAAVQAAMGDQGVQAEMHQIDLNSDGAAELVRADLDEWSHRSIHFYGADGVTVLGTFVPEPQHRLRAVSMGGHSGQVFLYENGEPDQPHRITILYMQGARVVPATGWDPKADSTTGNRISVSADGQVAVEWEMGDPARHTRTRKYSFAHGVVSLQSTSFAPQGDALVAPATQQDVLLAAFIARWFNLQSEVGRYFASSQAAGAFAVDPRITGADNPGTVKLGRVSGVLESGGCAPQVEEASVGESGQVGFAASWETAGVCSAVWGTVTFGADQAGRPTIAALEIEGSRSE